MRTSCCLGLTGLTALGGLNWEYSVHLSIIVFTWPLLLDADTSDVSYAAYLTTVVTWLRALECTVQCTVL